MKFNVERKQWVLACSALACLEMLPTLPLSAEEPKLSARLTDYVESVAFSPDGKTLGLRASTQDDPTLGHSHQ